MGFPAPVDSRLTAPLELPAESGKPLTTQGGTTLDDGTGRIDIAGNFSSPNVNYLNSITSQDGGLFIFDINGGILFGNGPVTLSQKGSSIAGASLSSGTGAPTIAGTAGDFFFRTDTPTTTNQRIYVCTVSGAAGAATWVGIV